MAKAFPKTMLVAREYDDDAQQFVADSDLAEVAAVGGFDEEEVFTVAVYELKEIRKARTTGATFIQTESKMRKVKGKK